jgi:NADH-quinone oxidoreductase subunit M
MQMVAHGLVAGALFLLVGLLYERTHTRDIGDYSSLIRVMPRFAFFTVLAFVAAVGLPGTAGFIAELHVLIGGFERWGAWVVLLSLGVIVSAAYAVRTVGRLCTGPVSARMRDVADLDRAEMIAAGVLAAGTLALGFFPAATLRFVAGSVDALARLFGA